MSRSNTTVATRVKAGLTAGALGLASVVALGGAAHADSDASVGLTLNVPSNWSSNTVCVAAYEYDGDVASYVCGEVGDEVTLEGLTGGDDEENTDFYYAFRFVDAELEPGEWDSYTGRDVWVGNRATFDEATFYWVPGPGEYYLPIFWFSDVTNTNSFYDDITWMGWTGISTGYPDGTYGSTRGVSRQAMAAFMYRFAGVEDYDAPEESPFPDVSTTHEFYTEIAWMAEAEISTGYTDGTYRPTDRVSRQAMSAFMFRLAGEPEFDMPSSPAFTDVSESHEFYTEIAWMAEAEISTGYDDNTYRPSVRVSRQAMAAFMYRLADELYEEDADLTNETTKLP